MKRIYCIINILNFLFIFAIGANVVTAKTLYDDFSSTYLDPSKWIEGEFVREVSQGKLVMILHNSPTETSIRKRAPFEDPSSINIIECDIMLSAATLDSGTDPGSFARVDGRFYNAKDSGTQSGDIWAGLYFGDRGNGLEAWWYVSEAIDENGNTWEDKGSGSLDVPGGLSYNQSYTVKIDYDGANEFTFTVAGVSNSFTGPVRKGAEYTQYKALETVVGTEEGAGDGYVSASFDNVLTNGSLYDDFSTAPLNQTKWQELEFVREIDNGKLRLSSHSTGDRQNARLYFNEVHPYTEVTITIKSDSQLEEGERGIARIDGNFYNDTYGPGSYNEHEGDVWVGCYLDYRSDGTLKAVCSVDKILDAADTESENLLYKEFLVPVILDRAYKFTIYFDGSWLRVNCQDTVTGREDQSAYEITTPVYEPYDKYLNLLSRVYGNAAGGYMAAEFDDVYVDVAEPPAIYDANGYWSTSASEEWSVLGDLPTVEDNIIQITQDGKGIIVVVPDGEGKITLTGIVYGDTYRFVRDVTVDGVRYLTYGIFHLSQNTFGTGSINMASWEDDVIQSVSGFNIALTKQADTDGDGIPDVSDDDDDDDGVLDVNDDFPLDDSETTDTDDDGTGDNADTDDDNDGVSDEEEASGPNSGDANNDSTQDSLQSNVGSLNVGEAQDYVVLESPDGTKITDCQVSETPDDAPASAVFDYGLFEFTLTGLAAGGTTTVTLTFPDDSPDFDTYYKFGPTSDNATPHWYEFRYDATSETGAKIDNSNNTITLYFKDGARGDDDLTSNCTIVDIGGPARTVDDDGDGGGGGGSGGGCFISIINL